MAHHGALIFGNNEYGLEIAKNVLSKYGFVTLFSLGEITVVEEDAPFYVERFDLSDQWEYLNEEYDMQQSIIFCALRDEAENIFLTISLRSAFPDIKIIALSNNQEDANKLKMAGATKVIPIVETTANMITDMLKKPIITSVLHDILYEETKLLRLVEIEITNAQYFKNKYPADIEWSRDHGVVVVSIIHNNGTPDFIYSSKTKHNYVENGDIFIVVGYEEDIKQFKKIIGN